MLLQEQMQWSLIEPFFSIEAITLLKEEVTKIVVNQMWEWDEQNDQLGVPYCIAALTQLATDEAIRNINILHIIHRCIMMDGYV
jgi:hypothetical protein